MRPLSSLIVQYLNNFANYFLQKYDPLHSVIFFFFFFNIFPILQTIFLQKYVPLQLFCLFQEVFNIANPVVKWAQTTLGQTPNLAMDIIATVTWKTTCPSLTTYKRSGSDAYALLALLSIWSIW